MLPRSHRPSPSSSSGLLRAATLLGAVVVGPGVGVVGCSAGAGSPTSDEAALSGATFQNPVVAEDCPDPGVTAVGSGDARTFVMVCTGGRFAIRTSSDLVRWRKTGKAILPSSGRAPWANDGERNWAPEIHEVAPGAFVAYFTASGRAGRLAIGAARAPGPLGPWTAEPEPLVEHEIGVIDSTYFADSTGRRWLYWKVDGNQVGKPTPILVRELGADGVSFAPGSRARQVLVNDPESWEGGVVEAPAVFEREGAYYLVYSGNVYDERYRTGVARASSPEGSFEKFGDPILENNPEWMGPGHGSIVSLGDTYWFIHHAWVAGVDGRPIASAGRQVLVDRLFWSARWPWFSHDSPTIERQPAPLAVERGVP